MVTVWHCITERTVRGILLFSSTLLLHHSLQPLFLLCESLHETLQHSNLAPRAVWPIQLASLDHAQQNSMAARTASLFRRGEPRRCEVKCNVQCTFSTATARPFLSYSWYRTSGTCRRIRRHRGVEAESPSHLPHPALPRGSSSKDQSCV